MSTPTDDAYFKQRLLPATTPKPSPEPSMSPSSTPAADPVSPASWPSPQQRLKVARRLHEQEFPEGLMRWRGRFWLWNEDENHWEVLDKADLRDRLYAALDGCSYLKPVRKDGEVVGFTEEEYVVDKALVDGVYDALSAGHSRPDEMVPDALVSFRDGHLRLAPDGRWRRVKKGNEVFNLSALPITLAEVKAARVGKVEPMQLLAFLDSIGWTEGTEERRLWQQWLGYVLSQRTDFQRALFITGPSRSGKGTLTKVAGLVAGQPAVSFSQTDLSSEFGKAKFIGRTLASWPDARLSNKGGALLDVVKQNLLSIIGGDPLSISQKYRDDYEGTATVRFMVSTNADNLNFSDEATNALADRFVYLTLNRSFLGKEDRDWFDRIGDTSELAALIAWSMDGLSDLLSAGQFVQPAAGQAVREATVLSGSTVKAWIADEQVAVDPAGAEVKADVYAAYAHWCDANGLRLATENSVHFWKQMRKEFDLADHRPRTKGKPIRQMRGIRLCG